MTSGGAGSGRRCTPPHALVSREPTSLNPLCTTYLALRRRAVVIPASGVLSASSKGFPTGHLLREVLYEAPEGKGNEAASPQLLPLSFSPSAAASASRAAAGAGRRFFGR